MFSREEFGSQFELLDGGRLLIQERWIKLFARHGLKSFADFMSTDKGKRRGQRAGRVRMRMCLTNDGKTEVFYMKRHDRPRLVRRVLGYLGLAKNQSHGRKELENIFHLKAAGLATLTAAAAGEAGPKTGSFIITEELSGYKSLHDFFEGLSKQDDKSYVQRTKQELVKALAEYVRKLHAGGMNHRDLYLCHFFVRPEEPSRTLTLLDLQRVQKRPRVRRHGKVKDLAALEFSAQQVGLGKTDKMRFRLGYFAVDKSKQLSWRQRLLLGSVSRKVDRIRRHDRKIQSKYPGQGY